METAIINFISGKGGVGKTSLAVNMAHFAASFGEKVLLIDCDLNTKGATHFFTEKMVDINTLANYLTTYALMRCLIGQSQISLEHLRPISIEKNFDFIPAAPSSEFDAFDQFTEHELNKQFVFTQLSNLISRYKQSYSIIIFDQCAGSTAMAECFTKLAVYEFMVAGTDALSMQAVRNLYDRFCSQFKGKRPFCCINQQQAEGPHVNSIIPQCYGIWSSQKFADTYGAGELLELGDNKLTARINEIFEFMFGSVSYRASRNYKKYIEKVASKRLQRRIQQTVLGLLIFYCFSLFAAIIIPIVLLINDKEPNTILIAFLIIVFSTLLLGLVGVLLRTKSIREARMVYIDLFRIFK